MQLAGNAQRRPIGGLRCSENRGGFVDFRAVGRKSAHDRVDLRWMNAPHPQKSEFVAGAARVVVNDIGIIERTGDAVSRNNRVGERGGRHFGFGTTHQRVVELAGAFHRRERDGAVMRADKIERAEVEARDPGQRSDRPHVMDGARRFD